ncbi:MAG TPA: sigma-54-dependent Fis family transcriptional regulator, partial [Rariglobus sp.]
MALFTMEERGFAEAVGRINATNPFLPERVACEREALGAEFVAAGSEWNKLPPAETSHPNHLRLTERARTVIEQVRGRWPRDGRVAQAEAVDYEELTGFWLYQTYALRFDAVIRDALAGRGGEGGVRADFFPAFKADVERCLALPGLALLDTEPAPHLFACAFQIRRAFHHIFRSLAGGSEPMARLR